MGFFGALGKIIQGKPVFEPNQNTGQPQAGSASAQPVAPQPASSSQRIGPKQQPEVEFEQVVCQTNGVHMECEVEIKNNSHGQVDLDRLQFLGTNHDLGTVLRAGEARQFRVYSGNRPNSTGYSKVELTVIDQTGDYWQLWYHIDFKAVGDGTYIVDRIRLQQVRDI
ncbi:MAG TPA: hypothetical protein VLA88_01910 [Candidatus Saccharimonadales bacterium]|nr:hypothetical protein [Candidatus Saccharimonadales bacterium]